MRLLDTNIFIRLLTRDDTGKAEACGMLFRRIALGKETAITTQTIIAEVAYVLSSKLYQLSHQEILFRLRPLLSFSHIKCESKSVCLRALALYGENQQLDFADAYAVALMEAKGLTEIYSFDTDFDRFSAIKRIEPSG